MSMFFNNSGTFWGEWEKQKTGDRYESASCFSYKSDMFISAYSSGRALGQVFSCP